MEGKHVLLLPLLAILSVRGVSSSIYKNLKHFETLHVSELRHNIVKRGVNPSSHPFNRIKEVSFHTLGRDFRLMLSPHTDVFHSKFKAYSVDSEGREKLEFVEHDNFFRGRVFGEIASYASVHLEDGMMTATIHVPEDTYHIEPSWRHLPNRDNESMISYRASDVHFSWDEGTGNEDTWPRTCGYVREGQEFEEEEDRDKRQAEQYEYTPTKTRCPLLLVADYRFYQEMGGSNTKTTINYLISLIDRVHKIYNDTTWQDRQEQDGFKGMGFVIKKIVVHSEPTRVRGGEAHYNMVREKWDVRNLLEVFARLKDNRDVCLSHLFTHQTFRSKDSTVLGLAYIASPRLHSLGGICTNG